MIRVSLVFPPFVESGLGNAYPSTAVLAAHLHQYEVEVVQADLNNPFLDWILRPEELEDAADSAFEASTPMSAAAARWLRSALDDGGIDRSDVIPLLPSAPTAVRNAIRELAKCYSIDPDRAVVEGRSPAIRAISSYDRFFAAKIATVLPGAQHVDLVGISVPMGPQLLPALRLAHAVRRRSPGTRVILGGPTISLLSPALLGQLLRNHPTVDAVVRMDGEVPLQSLCEQLDEGRWEPGQTPGVVSLHAGEVVNCPPAPGLKAKDLRTPAYDPATLALAPAARLGVTQARGCYWGKCDYCDFVEVFEGSPSYRGRQASLVIDDIESLVDRTGIRHFRLITESIPPAFSRRFALELLERDMRIGWSSFVMVDRRFDRETLELMAASGCDYLVVGLESMVTRVLELVHKSADREENFRFLHEAHAAGIALAVNLIPDLPSTTYAEAMAGLADLEELEACFQDVNVLRFETTASSRVGRAPEEFGLIPIESIGRKGQAELEVNRIPVVDPAMSRDEWLAVTAAYDEFAVLVNARRSPLLRSRPCPVDTRAALREEAGTTIVDFSTMQRSVFQRLDTVRA